MASVRQYIDQSPDFIQDFLRGGLTSAIDGGADGSTNQYTERHYDVSQAPRDRATLNNVQGGQLAVPASGPSLVPLLVVGAVAVGLVVFLKG